jgi:uncharacterized protein
VDTPIWLKSHSNGEYFHKQTPHEEKLRQHIFRAADENARRVGLERREFLASAMGMATTLSIISACGSDPENAGASGAGGSGGSDGGYCIPEEAQYNEELACQTLSGDEFIFDVQTHHFDPDSEWTEKNTAYMAILRDCGLDNRADCVDRNHYMDLLFCESDTTMAALSTWPAALCSEDRPVGCGLPLPNDEVARSRVVINQAANTQRIVNHCQVMPNDGLGIERQFRIMEEMVCKFGVSAWKCYPAWGPVMDSGFFLDDPVLGIPFIEKGLELGVSLFCVHKGLPIPGFDVAHNMPEDVGRVATRYRDANFVIYHSSICAGQTSWCQADEGAYDPANVTGGADTLIKSLEDNGIGPNENVFAELGSAFSQVMGDPLMAAHFIGKLLKHVGVDNVVWGTDAILAGSPQPLIEAFRKLEISTELQEKHGYPALTAAVKAKVFGLNAARIYGVDPEAKRCQVESCEMTGARQHLDEEFGGRRWTQLGPLGPRTEHDFIALARRNKAIGQPG